MEPSISPTSGTTCLSGPNSLTQMLLFSLSFFQDLRRKAARLVAAKCTLAARVDSFHESQDGKVGRKVARGVGPGGLEQGGAGT